MRTTWTSRRAVLARGKTDCAIHPESAIVMPDVMAQSVVSGFSRTLVLSPDLIQELQSELHRSRGIGGCRHPSTGGCIDGRVRQIEVHRVQEVERLRPELDRLRSIQP